MLVQSYGGEWFCVTVYAEITLLDIFPVVPGVCLGQSTMDSSGRLYKKYKETVLLHSAVSVCTKLIQIEKQDIACKTL